MKLVDNRYKVNKMVKDSTYHTVYEVVDFWDNDKKLLMKVYNTESQSKVIDYFINNFINISRINHPYLLACKQFSIIKTIDGRKVKFKQYYSTTEFMDAPTLEELHKDLSLDDKIDIILKVCTTLDYLHHRGIVYKLLSPSHIFIDNHRNIKLMDLASIYERIANTNYDNITRFFIAPEVILQNENGINFSADKYSLGMLIAYLLTDNFFKDEQIPYKYKHSLEMDEYQVNFTNQIISILTNKNPIVRDISIRDLIDDIIAVFNVDYKYDLVKEREVLNFETKIVGRDSEIRKILEYDDNALKGKNFTKMVLINGDEGVGKTRLLKEIAYLLRMRGREVYSIEINDSNNFNLNPLTEMLRLTLKDTPQNITEKYVKEFIDVLPELKLALGNNISNENNNHKNRLRLFDRVTNYFEDFASSREEIIYLIIDNVDDTSYDFLYLLDYLLHNISYGNLMLIVSYNEKKVIKDPDKYDVFSRWVNSEHIEKIKIGNLNLDEIGQFVQQILGINYSPLKFSAVLLKESRGNPRYIEYIIKSLHVKGQLYFTEKGFWEVKANEYSDIHFPSSLDEALKSQLEIIEEKYMEIMKILSASQSSLSKAVLCKIVNMDEERLNRILQELISLKLIDEVFSDWGFSYSINNIQLKKLIYYRLSKEEKEQIHRNLAQILEEGYKGNYEMIIEELTYHLVSSNQREKAIKILFDLTKKQNSLFGTSALFLWETAYEICKNTDIFYKIPILESLGKIYFTRGKNDIALSTFEKLYEEALKFNKLEYCVIANLGIVEIYLQQGLNSKALQKAEEAIDLAERIGYTKGIAESKLLYCRVLYFSNKMEKIPEYINDLMAYIFERDLKELYGHLYNLIGLYNYYLGNTSEAIENYKKSIKYFHENNQLIDSIKPMNNIAVIYFDLGQYDNAMGYFEAALSIADKHEVLNSKFVYLNNIGEIYMNQCEYEKAKACFEEAREIATDVGDSIGKFLTSLNLGLVYLYTSRYDQAYNCYKILKEDYSKYKNISFEVETQYYQFLGEFYIAFGKYDEAKKWYSKAMEQFKQYDISGYLISKSRLHTIDYLIERKFNRDQFDRLRSEFRNNNLNYIRRRFLLSIGQISFMEKDYDYLKDILAEDEELKEQYTSHNFDLLREMLIWGIRKDDESIAELIKIEEDMKKSNLNSLAVVVNIVLGNRAYEKGNYFQSFNYLVEALDLLYRLIQNVPVRDLQISFIKAQKTDEIKDKLSKVIYNVFGQEIIWTRIDELKPKDSIEKYFDYSSMLELMTKYQFAKLVENSYLYKDIKDIMDISDLLKELTDDYIYNLELILKFLCKETLAQRGCILVFEESKNEYVPIVKAHWTESIKPNPNLLALANRYEEGILLSTSLESNVIGLYKELLPKNIKALICVPITVKEKKVVVKKERRKIDYNSIQKSQGFILLETDRLFNRFDKKRISLARNLINIIYLNIENYKLKILSTIDRLTGTYTRKYLESALSKKINESKMNQRSFALIMLDIDDFKFVNDTYGHRAGDIVLSKIGGYLVENVRKTDIVARYGGEEFVIILNNVEEEQAIKIAENIRKGVSKINYPGIDHTVTISVGVSLFPKHSQFKEELLIKADQALYSAKEKGKNRVVVWNANLSDSLNRVDRLAGILTGNINTDQTNVLAILDTISIVKETMNKEDKIFAFLGKVIEVLEAEYSSLILLGDDGKIASSYSRKRFCFNWVENSYINHEIISRVLANKKGEFLIDWDTGQETAINLNTPNWQSVIVLPLTVDGQVKGIGYMTVPIKEKEFDFDSYNLAKTLWDVFSTVL
jgi:diguanylate cyclase (GGDEF)-like protein